MFYKKELFYITFCYIYRQKFGRIVAAKSIKKLKMWGCFVEKTKELESLVLLTRCFVFYGIAEQWVNGGLICKTNCRYRLKLLQSMKKRISFSFLLRLFFTYRWKLLRIPSCQHRETPLRSFAVACCRWGVSFFLCGIAVELIMLLIKLMAILWKL